MSLDKNNLFPTIRSHKLTLIIETETSKIMKEKSGQIFNGTVKDWPLGRALENTCVLIHKYTHI